MKIKAKEKPGIVQQRQSKAIRRTAMEKLSGDLISKAMAAHGDVTLRIAKEKLSKAL